MANFSHSSYLSEVQNACMTPHDGQPSGHSQLTPLPAAERRLQRLVNSVVLVVSSVFILSGHLTGGSSSLCSDFFMVCNYGIMSFGADAWRARCLPPVDVTALLPGVGRV